MHIDSTISVRPRPRRSTLLAIAWPWQMLLNAVAERRTFAELSRLDDYMLKDIGISRGNIHSAIRENRRNTW